MKATIFNPLTGKILRVVSCPVGIAGLQCRPGEDWIEGGYQDDSFYVQSLTAVPMPPRPSANHVFNYTTKQWEPDCALAWAAVKAKRNRLLSACDWTQLPDVPPPTKEAWATYRQALRDVPEQPDPFNIAWPAPPA